VSLITKAHSENIQYMQILYLITIVADN
jgi:hypothetical protein